MRAFLTVSRQGAVLHLNQHAGIVFFGILEQHKATVSKLAQIGYLSERRFPASLAQEVGDNDPDLSDNKREADQNQKFREIPTRDILILRKVHREVLPPLWLFGFRAAIRKELIVLTHSDSPESRFT